MEGQAWRACLVDGPGSVRLGKARLGRSVRLGTGLLGQVRSGGVRFGSIGLARRELARIGVDRRGRRGFVGRGEFQHEKTRRGRRSIST